MGQMIIHRGSSGGGGLSALHTVVHSYDASNVIEYVGVAPAGTATNIAGWKIRKTVFSSAFVLTSVTQADGDALFDNVWDDRASLSYS